MGTPDAGAFWRVIADYSVEALFTAPTAIRAIRRDDPDGSLMSGHDLSSLRTLFLAGERLDPDTYEWATETLASRRGQLVADRDRLADRGQPAWPRPDAAQVGIPESSPVPATTSESSTRPGPEVAAGQDGAICIKLPLPPGLCRPCGTTTTASSTSYLSAFDGYYLSGDGGHVDADGYLFVMGRTDDVHQCRRAPPVHGLDRGGAREAPCRR